MKKNQTVATEENVFNFIESDVYVFIDTLRQLGCAKKFEHEHAMQMLNANFANISDELMVKVNKALEDYDIVEVGNQETKKETKNAEKPVKWVFSKAVKIDTFNRMCEKAWADSGLKDELIKQEVYDKLAKWHKMSKQSPLAGYNKHHRPHSQEELEKEMYECFDIQFYQYDGYKGNN